MITCFFENQKKLKGGAFLRHAVTGSIIEKNEKLLLVKRAPSLLQEANKWTIPGGFLEFGETISQGTLRETLEETGYKAKIITLFRINDNPDRKGEDRQNIDFIFLVKAIKKISEPDHETSEIKWFSPDELPQEKDFAFDHFENIQLYLKWKKEKFKLPVWGQKKKQPVSLLRNL